MALVIEREDKFPHNNWIEVQDSLRRRLITEDRFSWRIPSAQDRNFEQWTNQQHEILKYVGGVDLSFSKNEPSIACATLVVLDLCTLEVVYEDSAIVELRVPYIPGFLAFREAPVLVELLQKMKKRQHPSFPQLLMVDGNGLLHPRGFGLACHIGVLVDIPVIGIGKNLHHVDGLSQSSVRQMLKANADSCNDNCLTLVGETGSILGVAMRSTDVSQKPIFISIGHCISLESAIKIVKLSCKFRIPEPIRQILGQKLFFGCMAYADGLILSATNAVGVVNRLEYDEITTQKMILTRFL